MKTARVAITITAALLALAAAMIIWHHYMVAPWTRDGRVRAEVVAIAPEISGTVAEIGVTDNQFVHKGDVLFVLDQERYKLAATQAKAIYEMRQQDMHVAQSKAKRRERLSDFAASVEQREQFNSSAAAAAAAADEASAQLSLARLNLARTVVRSPVNGYVTNLRLRVGDYASAGQAAVALVDKDSFWIAGYFEETKLANIREGDSATVELMSFPIPLHGKVESIARGIIDQNGEAAGGGLAKVDPVFTWVRLAQRIPVRVRLENVPEELKLAQGMTCTVSIGKYSVTEAIVEPFAWLAKRAG